MAGPLDEILAPPPAPAAPSFRYGTVTGTNPLRVRLDGDTNPVASTPATIAAVAAGDRVLVMIHHRQLTVLGAVATAWRGLTLQNGWQNYGRGGYSDAQYRRVGGLVYVRGLIVAGALGAETVCAVLPAGHRPNRRLIFPAISRDDAGPVAYTRLDVTPAGEIITHTGGNSWFSINCSFPADQ